jgi:arabinofuranan 3-O-arabinosyltransferase
VDDDLISSAVAETERLGRNAQLSSRGRNSIEGTASPDDRIVATFHKWMRLNTPWLVLLVIAVEFGRHVYRTAHGSGVDLVPVWAAGNAFLQGMAPYELPKGVMHFLYPPASVVLLSPLATLRFAQAQQILAVVNATTILAGSVLVLRAFDISWRSLAGAGLLLVLAFFLPAQVTLDLGQVNGPIYVGEALFLLMVIRGRWIAAATSLGLTLMLKPILLPLLLILVIERQRKALALAISIPVLTSGAALLVVKNPMDYFTHTLPFLFSQRGPENVSVAGILEYVAAPPALTLAARLLVTLGAVVAFLWVWRSGRDTLRQVALMGILLSAAFLVTSPSWPHYGIYLLPTIVGLAVMPGAGRSALVAALVAGALIGMPQIPALVAHPGLGFTLEHARFTLGTVMVLGAAAIARWPPLAGQSPAISIVGRAGVPDTV